jgi:glutamate 5-kinase
VRVGPVERGHDLVVVSARLAVAQELHALDLDFLRVGLRLEQLLAVLGQERFAGAGGS